MVRKFFPHELRKTTTKSLVCLFKRIGQTYTHRENPLDYPANSASTRLFTCLLRSFIPLFSASAEVKVSIDQFAVIKYIGSGATGAVFEAEDNITRGRVALKVVKKPLLCGRVHNIIREQRALAQNVGNLHAVQLHASFHDTVNSYMVMPLQSGGDLHQRIVSMGTVLIDLAKFYTAELLVGLHGLHSRGILHRDIKPCNLLINHKGHLLISDFGLSKVFPVNVCGAPPPYCSGLTEHLSGAPYLVRGLLWHGRLHGSRDIVEGPVWIRHRLLGGWNYAL